METIDIVIRINKNTFDAINELSKFVDGNHIINGYQMKGHSTVGSMITAIAKGTVLPKGHGDLKDMGNLQYVFDLTREDSIYSGKDSERAIKSMTTIIEADKEVSE